MSKELSVPEILDSMKELYIAKNSNYGDSVSQVPSLAPDVIPSKAVRVRMSDKINRMQQLFNGEPDKVGESVNDTIKDLALYCVIYLSLVSRGI